MFIGIVRPNLKRESPRRDQVRHEIPLIDLKFIGGARSRASFFSAREFGPILTQKTRAGDGRSTW